jgi:hypothetical protein
VKIFLNFFRVAGNLPRPAWQFAGAAAAFAIPVVAAAWFAYGADPLGRLAAGLGGADDALRMVLVREFLGGHPWWDNHIARLQPPLGLEMHWSRLIDWGLAELIRVLSLVLAPASAEFAARAAWPLIWIAVAAVDAVTITRRLGAAAIPALAILTLFSPAAFLQFHPGRIDHHNVQIALVLTALAATIHMDRSHVAGWIAGSASGIALGVGLECLLLIAALGLTIAIWLAANASLGPAARRYAAALFASLTLLLLIQNPPSEWATPLCDELAVNLWLAVTIAAGGLTIAASAGLSARQRAAILIAAGCAGAAAYVAVQPACAAGPFGQVDPALWPIWLDHATESVSLLGMARGDLFSGLLLAIGPAVGLIGIAVAMRSKERRSDPAWLITGACFLVAAVMVSGSALKGACYAAWLGAVVAAGALSSLRLFRKAPGAGAALLAIPISPLFILALVEVFAGPETSVAAAHSDTCQVARSFSGLAKLKPGLVVSEIDMGPLILAYTPHSALSAPYHRMAFGIRAAYDILADRGPEAPPRLGELGVSYIALCPDYSAQTLYADLPRDSLYWRLRDKRAPASLRLTPDDGPLLIYAVERPPTASE